jgi:hypothetical protein
MLRSAPYAWLVAFFLAPFLIVLKISLSQTAIAQPPYLPLFDFTEGWAAIKAAFAQLSLDNFRLLVSDNLYISSYLRSLVVAVTSTLILFDRLSHRLWHGAVAEALAGGGAGAGDPAVLDLVPDPHLRLDQHPPA